MSEHLTIKEIARLAGVNISTVSRALNPQTAAKISTERREKILEICDKHNYRPRVAARACATGKTFRIGLIVGTLAKDLASPLHALFIRGLCSVLQHHGYTLSILWAEEEPEKRDKVVRHFLMSENADGYVLGAPLLAPQTLETFQNAGHPILSLSYHNSALGNTFPVIKIDPLSAFRDIWQVMPQGVNKLLWVGTDDLNSRKKFEEFSSCCQGEKNVNSLFYSLENGSASFHYDYLCARSALASRITKLLEAQLICCSSDLVAWAVCDLLSEKGIKIGKDIFVLGYDNIEKETPCPGRKPFLSTIDTQWEKAGRESARLILASVSSQKALPLETVINSTYICRKSFPFDLQKKENRP